MTKAPTESRYRANRWRDIPKGTEITVYPNDKGTMTGSFSCFQYRVFFSHRDIRAVRWEQISTIADLPRDTWEQEQIEANKPIDGNSNC